MTRLKLFLHVFSMWLHKFVHNIIYCSNGIKRSTQFSQHFFFLLTIYPFKTSHCLPFMFIVYLLKHSSLIAVRIALILILLLNKHRPKYLFKLLHVFILPTET